MIIETPAYRALELFKAGQPVLARDILIEAYAADAELNFTHGRIANMIDLREPMNDAERESWDMTILGELRRMALNL